jgi:hypothetical protein
VARAEGHNKWQTNSDENFSNLKFAAGQLPAEHDDCVSRLFKPTLSTQAVILKVRVDIARRGRPLPEIIFISPEHHPEALMRLVVKVRELADQLANLGSFAVCDRNGDSYVIAGVNEE